MTKSIKLLSIALTAATLVAFAPERLLRSAHADSVGRFCAAPVNGNAYCVSSSRSPADAWNQAAIHGRLPIEMWAEWPSDVTLDELVGSRERLEAWFADTDKVLSYVRDTQKNAESYKASMAGRLSTLMRRVEARQAEILNKR
jgi:hypothetical protein